MKGRKSGKTGGNKLHEQMQELHFSLRRKIGKRWARCLPFNEELFDRWERAKYLGFGRGSSIYDSAIVLGPVKVGENTWVGPFVVLDGSGGLSIGSYCSISAGVQIYSHDSVDWAISGGKELLRRNVNRGLVRAVPIHGEPELVLRGGD